MILLNKPVGITPLQAIEKFREQNPLLKDVTLSYAGRLDPMAEGLLLVLEGEENKKRGEYEKLAKTYLFSVLFGVSTDTYDLLGKITETSENSKHELRNSNEIQMTAMQNVSDLEVRISNLLPSLLGKQIQTFPPYSSKTVQGKPLYWWARNNRLEQIEIPKKNITITNLDLNNLYTKPTTEIQLQIFNKLNLIRGDFRQEDIMRDWKTFFKNTKDEVFLIADFSITCSSGTYVRGLVHTLGKKLSCQTTTYTITRTRVGEYDIKNVRILKG